MNGSFSYGKLLEEGNHQDWTPTNEKQLNKLHQEQAQEKYCYRLNNKFNKRHKSMVADSTNIFIMDKINKTLDRKQWSNTCPEFRKEFLYTEQKVDAPIDIVSNQMHSVQEINRMYKAEDKIENKEKLNDNFINKYTRVSDQKEQEVNKPQENMEIITPFYINQLASVNSLLLLHNVAKLVTEEPIVLRKNDYITDQLEDEGDKGGNNLGQSNEEFIKVVDFCEEEAKLRNRKQQHLLLPAIYRPTRVCKKSCKKSKSSKVCNIWTAQCERRNV